MRSVVDIITVRALRYGLEPYAPAELVAADLAQLAADRREPLLSALRRINSGRLERKDHIVERARDVLERALADLGETPGESACGLDIWAVKRDAPVWSVEPRSVRSAKELTWPSSHHSPTSISAQPSKNSCAPTR